MEETKINMMLHPIRMRIIQTLLNKKKLNVHQICEFLPEVPQATMYRHLNKLLEAEIINVVEEKRIRGTVERVYSLLDNDMQIKKEEYINISKDDHFKYFFTFVIQLLGNYKNYLNQQTYDVLNDGVSYKQASVYMSDSEFTELMKNINTTVLKATENKPYKGRRLRTIATIVIPGKTE